MKTSNDTFKKSQLVQLLKTLTKKEFKDLGKFVASPFHNNRSEVVKFYNVLKKYYPAFDSTALIRESLYSKVYPKQKYRDDVFRRLSSHLMKVCEEYHKYICFREDSFLTEFLYIEEYKDRGMNRTLLNKLRKMETDLEIQKTRSQEYYYRKFQIENLKTMFCGPDNKNSLTKQGTKIVESLINYSVISLLMHYGMALTDSNIVSNRVDMTFLKQFLSIVEDSGLKLEKCVLAYYYMVKAYLDSDSNEWFIKLKTMLDENQDLFSKEEMKILYYFLKNFIEFNSIFKNEHKSDVLFDIVKTITEKNLLVVKNEIRHDNFIYVIDVSLDVKEYTFLTKFIERYKSFLPESIRLNVLNFVYSKIEYRKRNYIKSLEHLKKVKFTFYNDRIQLNVMLLRLYYDLEYYETAEFQIENFRKLLKRNSLLNNEHSTILKNYISFYAKLLKIKNSGDIEMLELLRSEVLNSQMWNQWWILEKIDELQKQKA